MPRPTLADRRRTARDNLTPDTHTTVSAPPTDSAPSADDEAVPVNSASTDTASTTPAVSSAISAPSTDAALPAHSAGSAASTLSAVSAPSAAGAGGAGTISVSLTNRQIQDARAAFLADWEHGSSDAVTFTAWIEHALLEHVARTPIQRATDMVAASGQTRSFRISDDTRTLIEAAVTTDCADGHWISLSAWAATAITTATDMARRRGPLPTPPTRLPGRLPARAERKDPRR